MIKIVDGAWSFNNLALTRVGQPVLGSNAVNVKFMHDNTITLQDDKFNAVGKNITNIVRGTVDKDVVNMHQLNDLKQHTESELYKINIMRYHIDRTYNKLQQSASRSSVGDEDSVWMHTAALIETYDKSTEVKDWRSVYE